MQSSNLQSEDEEMQARTGSFEDGPPFQKTAPVRLSASKRKRQLEESLDLYLEEMDQQARQEEEARLLSFLSTQRECTIKQEQPELGRRPKVPRKSVEDVKIWTRSYQAEWEAFPKAQPPDGSPEKVGGAIAGSTENNQL